jgi:Ca2+-binding EF-hand superfamily protein
MPYATFLPSHDTDNVDRDALQALFKEYDTSGDGKISLDELEVMLAQLGVAPMKDPMKRTSASSDAKRKDEE